MPWTIPETFTAGQTLTAASMNKVSDNLNELRTTPSFLSASDTTSQSGGAGADFTYTTAEITITAGTWRVQAGASIIANVADDVAVGIWNQTTSALVANSTCGAATASSTQRASLLSRVVEIVVTSNTALRVRCRRQGASTITAASSASGAAAFIHAERVTT